MIFSTLSLNGKLPQCNHVVNPVPSSRLPTKPVHVEWWCHTLGTTAKCVDLSEDRLPIAWTTDLSVKSPIHSTRAPSMMTNTKLTDQWSLQYTHRTVGIEHLFHQSQILTARANPALLHHRTRTEKFLCCFSSCGERTWMFRGNWFPDLHKKANTERWIEVTKAMQWIVWQILSPHTIICEFHK